MARKPGKYDHITPHLPKLSSVEPEHAQLVDSVKAAILAPPNGEVPATPERIRAEMDILTKQVEWVIAQQQRTTAGRPWASEFARAYAELRYIKAKIDNWGSSAGLLMEAYKVLMLDQFEAEGIRSMKLDTGQPVTTYSEPHAVIVNKEEHRRWCIEQGLEHEMVLPWGTTNAITKRMLIDGLKEPPGVEAFSKPVVRLGSE